MSTPHKSKNRLRRFIRLVLGLISGGLLLGVGLFVYLMIATPQPPSFDDVMRAHRPSDAVLLDRHGEVLHRLRVNFDVRQGAWMGLDDISPSVTRALLSTEDKRFYEHFGVDVYAVFSAAWNNLNGSPSRGASTLSMQLAGLLDERIAPSGRRNLWQKMQQAAAAIELEQHWNKNQILEAYLNIVPFRGELVGISAMSEGLLDKHPNGIDEREAAMAIALIRSPNASQEIVARRACVILEQIQAMNATQECQLLSDFIHVRFSQPRSSPSQGIALHVARSILKNALQLPANQPLEVRSTLDAAVQRTALASLNQHLQDISQHHIEDGAVIVMDNATGEVIAWVGSSGQDISQAAHVDTVMALRQPGSTLKPFLFGMAIEEKRLTAASLLDDSPINLNVGGGLYVPQNYDREYKGLVSVRTALASSLNIPTVRTLVMVRPDKFANTLIDLGLPLKESGDYYGYSLALGSAEVTLLTLTNAYRALANGGKVSAVRWLPQESAPPPLPSPSPSPIPLYALSLETHASSIGPQAAWIIGAILSDRHARVSTFGLDSELSTRYWSAVKTGTSKDMRDNWAIGYSARYTVGVWVGNASGAAMWGISGTSGASPVWRDVMNYLYERDLENGRANEWAAPAMPEGIIPSMIHYEPQIEPDRLEYFIEGTERETISIATHIHQDLEAATTGTARIISPVSGIIIALDPDIPPQNQRLRLQSNQDHVRWMLGEYVLGTGAQVDWLPLPGRHTLVLVDEQGKQLDRTQVEVRGASMPRGAPPRAPQQDIDMGNAPEASKLGQSRGL